MCVGMSVYIYIIFCNSLKSYKCYIQHYHLSMAKLETIFTLWGGKLRPKNQSAIDIQSYIASIYIYLVFNTYTHISSRTCWRGRVEWARPKKKNAVRAKTAGSAMQCDASRRLQYAGALLFLWERAAARRDANASYYTDRPAGPKSAKVVPRLLL